MVVAGGAGVGWWATHRSDNQTQAAAQTTTTLQAATVGTVSQTLTISGTFAPAQEADLDFASSGTVTAVNVAVGDKVTKGQVLATIDDTDLAASLASAKSTLSSAQENLESVEDSGTSTQIAAAKATVASDESKVTQAQKVLAAASMTAPFSGTIATVNIAAGDTSGSSSSSGAAGSAGGGSGGAGGDGASGSSSSSSSAIVLVDTSSWTVNANVSSADLAQLAKGQSTQVSISTASSSSSNSRGGFPGFGGGGGFGGSSGGSGSSGSGSSSSGSSSTGSGSTGTTTGTALAGTIQSVGIVGTTSTGSTATFPVVVKVSGTESGIYVGTSASVVVTTKSVNNVLTVPTTAISTSNGKSVVTVSKNGATQQEAISTGSVYGTRTQVLSGVAAGEMVQVTSRGPGAFGGARAGGTAAPAAEAP